LAEFVLCDRHALSAVNFRESAGEYRLGLVVKRTDELRFPAVPDTRTDRPDIGGGGKNQKLLKRGPLYPLRQKVHLFLGGKGTRLVDAAAVAGCFCLP